MNYHQFRFRKDREFWIEEEATSNQYYDFENVITIKGVVGTLAHFGYDNLFAMEVVNRMKELKRI